MTKSSVLNHSIVQSVVVFPILTNRKPSQWHRKQHKAKSHPQTHKPQSEARASIFTSIKSTSQRSKSFNFNNFLLVIYIEIRALLIYEPRPLLSGNFSLHPTLVSFFLPTSSCVFVFYPFVPLWLSTAPPTPRYTAVTIMAYSKFTGAKWIKASLAPIFQPGFLCRHPWGGTRADCNTKENPEGSWFTLSLWRWSGCESESSTIAAENEKKAELRYRYGWWEIRAQEENVQTELKL